MSVVARGFFYVQQVEQHARRLLDECLQVDGLTAGQYMALSLVARHEPASSADLARRAHITPQSMGEFVKALESKGLLQRRTDANNRRAILLTPTPTGRKVLLRSEARVDNAERRFFDCLPDEEYKHLRQLLSRVRAIRGQNRV
jgi:DNA-binding MarR family transcriptional regulator